MKLTEKVPVDRLGIGMYVAQLDRPWLETPFLFQGFYIRDDDEISELGAHCDYVYVSRESLPVDQQDAACAAPATPIARTVNQPAKKRFSLRAMFKSKCRETHEIEEDFEQSSIFYRNTKSLKEEMHTASGVHKQAVATVQGVMDNLKKSGNLDLEGIEAAVSPMVDSVLRNPAALACLMRMQKKDNYLYKHSLASSV